MPAKAAGKDSGLWMLGLAEAAVRIAAGEITAEALTQACLARIEALEPELRAFAFLDPAHALAQAQVADRRRKLGQPTGPLNGVPVGLKDIIDTADQPTENGSVLDHGRRPRRDAQAVSRLRQAGAVILGKTITTEFAVYHPGPTRNPHDPRRTPGGSSSGSAAAVAAAMLPGALGSQTNGSVVRPASFCGVFGFKPSFGRIGRSGVLRQSQHLDHLGCFARSLEDIALLADCLFGPDADDAAAAFEAQPTCRGVAAEDPPVPPRIAFVRTPVWSKAEPGTVAAFEELVGTLGKSVEEVELPARFAEAWPQHRRIMTAELAANLGERLDRGGDKVSRNLRDLLADGRKVTAADYLAALAAVESYRNELAHIFEVYDAILTPAAPGEAPQGLGSTGDPVFCTLWTLTGLPSLSLPILTGPTGLPLGAQLVGAVGDDARLLRTARWLLDTLLPKEKGRRRRR